MKHKRQCQPQKNTESLNYPHYRSSSLLAGIPLNRYFPRPYHNRQNTANAYLSEAKAPVAFPERHW
jgi:hypothetical protein